MGDLLKIWNKRIIFGILWLEPGFMNVTKCLRKGVRIPKATSIGGEHV
jgi:hypothetical protein